MCASKYGRFLPDNLIFENKNLGHDGQGAVPWESYNGCQFHGKFITADLHYATFP
jgi:hypothetical protein